MLFLRIIRIVITALLVIFLLAVGSIAMITYSVQDVVLDSSYFSVDLLYSGAYNNALDYVLDNLSSNETDSSINNGITYSMLRSIEPVVFSNIAADYSSSWMKYLLGEVPANEIPVLNLSEYQDYIHYSALMATNDEDFLISILSQQLEAEGLKIEDYSQEDQIMLLETYEVKEIYLQSIETALNDENSVLYQKVTNVDPLNIISSGSNDLAQENMITKIKNYHGILNYYKSVAMLAFAGIIACICLIFIMWITYLKVPLFINGIVTILISVPVFIISYSKNAFNAFVLMIMPLLPIKIPTFNIVDFHGNYAIWPIINSMLVVSSIGIVIGVIFIVAGILAASKKKKPKKAF